MKAYTNPPPAVFQVLQLVNFQIYGQWTDNWRELTKMIAPVSFMRELAEFDFKDVNPKVYEIVQ